MTDIYNDLIYLEYTGANLKMPISKRASIFAPFSALTGYNEAIIEVEREILNKVTIDDSKKDVIDETLRYIKSDNNTKAVITYFVKDTKKTGGIYKDITGFIRKIDEFKKIIILDDGNKVPINDIINIEII